MPVAHQPLVAISGQLGGMIAEKGCNFRLHGLRQQRSRAVAQHLGQRVGKRPWLGELDHIILGHGVSLLQWRSGGVEHPHDTPPYPFTPSPTFVHNSNMPKKRSSWLRLTSIKLPDSGPLRQNASFAGDNLSISAAVADPVVVPASGKPW